jgi:glycosyltransferase involved in cell wall biosynthesis
MCRVADFLRLVAGNAAYRRALVPDLLQRFPLGRGLTQLGWSLTYLTTNTAYRAAVVERCHDRLPPRARVLFTCVVRPRVAVWAVLHRLSLYQPLQRAASTVRLSIKDDDYRRAVLHAGVDRVPFGPTLRRAYYFCRLMVVDPAYRRVVVHGVLHRLPLGWRLLRAYSLGRQIVRNHAYRRALLTMTLDRVPKGYLLRRGYAQWQRVARSATNLLRVRLFSFSQERQAAFAYVVEQLGLSVAAPALLAHLVKRMTPADLASLLALLDTVDGSLLGSEQRPTKTVIRTTDLMVETLHEPEQRRRNILFITGEFPNVVHGGGGRVMDFIKIMSQDNNVYLFSLYDEHSDRDSYDMLLPFCQKIKGVTISDFEGNVDRIKAFVTGIPIDIVHYEWPRSLTNFDRSLGRLHIFTYMEAVSLRLAMDLQQQRPLDDRWTDTLLKLLASLKIEVVDAPNADILVVVTEKDGEFLARINPLRPYFVVNHGITLDEFCLPDREADERTLMYIGNYLHYPSEDAIQYFFGQIYEAICREVPDLRVFLVGANPTPTVMRYHQDGRVIVTGRVDDFRPYIQQATVCIAPLVSGAGLRTKVIQYAALRRACVATSIATADLMLRDGSDICIADDPATFAERVVFLLKHPEVTRAMAASAYEKACMHYDNQRIVRSIYALYASAAGREPTPVLPSVGGE